MQTIAEVKIRNRKTKKEIIKYMTPEQYYKFLEEVDGRGLTRVADIERRFMEIV